MERLFWICIGGAAGTAARYGIALWAAGRFSGSFPVGTVVVNLVGCFAIALVMYIAMALAWPATLRLAITVGFLGGFTTYSSFNYETSRLLLEGATTAAGLNLLATMVGGLLAGWLGLVCARQIVGH
jgi:fluoride exporter